MYTGAAGRGLEALWQWVTIIAEERHARSRSSLEDSVKADTDAWSSARRNSRRLGTLLSRIIETKRTKPSRGPERANRTYPSRFVRHPVAIESVSQANILTVHGKPGKRSQATPAIYHPWSPAPCRDCVNRVAGRNLEERSHLHARFSRNGITLSLMIA
jgi:hypothetical protein